MRISFSLTILATVFALSMAMPAEAKPTGGEGRPADKVFLNGVIHTVDPQRPRAEALAIVDGHFMRVGDNADVKPLIGPETEIVDLEGRLIIPGLNDAHVHAVDGAIAKLFECNFSFTATPDEIAKRISECVAAQPDAEWIMGGRWGSSFFVDHKIESPRRWLDQYSGGAAVVLIDDTRHNAWLNTRALKLLNITDQTEDPEGGEIQREGGTRTPNGLLIEGAALQLRQTLPEWTPEQFVEAAREVARIAASFGITGWKEATAAEKHLKAYHALDTMGELEGHAAACIVASYGQRDEPLDYGRLDNLRRTYGSARFNTDCVKMYMDGVPNTARTAAMLHPYLPDPQFPEGFNGGETHIPLETLVADLTKLDQMGITAKIHATGDRAVRIVLDAIEKVREINGPSGLRHEIAHAGFVADADIPRFAELNAVADLSPYIWYPSPIMQSIKAALGERGEHYFPIRSLLEADAPVAAGSDWPSVVPSMNPWVGIEGMVTRQDPLSNDGPALWPAEAISLEQAIEIYTLSGARALRLVDKTGSITAGKSA
ncbi:MAG TPA: amidohydrolase, partial [Nitrospira sp.]|nr:amidohydrolase [Nitrospira sp.]